LNCTLLLSVDVLPFSSCMSYPLGPTYLPLYCVSIVLADSSGAVVICLLSQHFQTSVYNKKSISRQQQSLSFDVVVFESQPWSIHAQSIVAHNCDCYIGKDKMISVRSYMLTWVLFHDTNW
jgi:hypothetical protein